jgi:hypothetical protein
MASMDIPADRPLAVSSAKAIAKPTYILYSGRDVRHLMRAGDR